MDSFLQDVRYAVRKLLRTPGFTFIAVLTLALGIGATTAMWAIVDGILIRPLPYPDPRRVVQQQGQEAERDVGGGLHGLPQPDDELRWHGRYGRRQRESHAPGFGPG